MYRTSESILSNIVPKIPDASVTAIALKYSDNFTFSDINFDRFQCENSKNKLTKFRIIASNNLFS